MTVAQDTEHPSSLWPLQTEYVRLLVERVDLTTVGTQRMTPNRPRLFVCLLPALLWVIWSAAAEEPVRQLDVETEIPRRGDYTSVGFEITLDDERPKAHAYRLV